MPNEIAGLNDDEPKLMLSPGVYDKLKLSVQVLLPGLSTLYFALGGIWGFPEVEKVIGTIAALTVFLGSLVAISHKRYVESDERFDGVMKPVIDGGGVNGFSMELRNRIGVEDLQNKDEVTFKVKPIVVE